MAIPVNLALAFPFWVYARFPQLPGALSTSILVVWVVAFVLNYALAARRLHDLGRSAWWLLVLYVLPLAVPLIIYNLLSPSWRDTLFGWVSVATFVIVLGGLVVLGFVAGNAGPNRYGADPKGRMALDVFD
ncbi:MAG: DUF805 domain-containing protein [Phenylobacterium sp.]|nr:DUF805 domain-containing protein [Phenylobacterium sp.]